MSEWPYRVVTPDEYARTCDCSTCIHQTEFGGCPPGCAAEDPDRRGMVRDYRLTAEEYRSRIGRPLAGVIRKGLLVYGIKGGRVTDWPVMTTTRSTPVRVRDWPERSGWWITVGAVPGMPADVEALIIDKALLKAS